MSQKYKDKYEELRNNDLGTKQSNDDSNPKEDDSYATPGNVRNIGFVWEDGRKMFLNYAYLISSEFNSTENENTITLIFTSHQIKLEGYKLLILYESIFNQKARIVLETSKRYFEEESDTFQVTRIEISIK